MPAVEDRVDRLEIALQDFIHSVGIEFNKAYKSNEEFKAEMKVFKDEMTEFKNEMKVFKDEMTEFKNEMKVFKDEMTEFKNEMKVFKDEMTEFKNEMKVFKDEMTEFKNEMKVFKDEMTEFKAEMSEFKTEMKIFKDEMHFITTDLNKKFGEMSRKLGTIVEDLVLPSLPRIVMEKFGFDLEEFSINIKFKKEGRNQEFDALGVYKNFVFLNSTKATLREDDIRDLKNLIKQVPFWFPQHRGKKIFGVLAGFDIQEKIIKLAEKNDFLIMGVGGDLMELVNSKDFMPKGTILS